MQGLRGERSRLRSRDRRDRKRSEGLETCDLGEKVKDAVET